MANPLLIGPALEDVLRMQRQDDDVFAAPNLEIQATAVARLCHDMGDPLLWPVGPAAERLSGAAALAGDGAVRVRGWMTDIEGEHVLLITLHSLTPLPLLQAAEQARRLGAAEVHACAIHLDGAVDPMFSEAIDAYHLLSGAGTLLHVE